MRLERIAAKVAGRYKVSPRTKVETIESVLKSLGVRNADLIANKIVRMQGDTDEVLDRLEVQFGIPIVDGLVEGNAGSVDLRQVRDFAIDNDLEAIRSLAEPMTVPIVEEDLEAPADDSMLQEYVTMLESVFGHEADWGKLEEAARILKERVA